MKKIIKFILSTKYFSEEKGKAPVLASYEAGKSNLLILTGENAEGKSFFTKLFQEYCETREKVNCARIGMELRTSHGLLKVFVYRSELEFSTGHNSIESLVNGIKSFRNWQNPHYIVFDEPTIGLSEGYQIAMGQYLAEFSGNLPKNIKGLVIVTHSRYLIKPLLPLDPHHIRFGDSRKLEEWVNSKPEAKSIKELLELPGKGIDTFRKICRIIDKRKK